MKLNSSPIRPVSDEDIATYARDGAVCLRNVFDKEYLSHLRDIAEEIMVDEKDFGLLPHTPNRFMSRKIEAFRRFAFESAMGEACAKVLQSKEIRFFFDEIFAKPPKCDHATIWHCDRMGWPVSGHMVPSLWIPLVPVARENCLEVLAGSQVQDKKYWLFSPNAQQMIRPDDRIPHPQIEPLRGQPGIDIKTWEMDVGDMLVIHPWALHYSSGNQADTWRYALSVRVLGDDIRWAPRPDCINIPGICWDEMIPGEKPAGYLFPKIYSEDGTRDTDEAYPRGFAAEWSRDAKPEKVEMLSLNSKLQESGGGSKVSREDMVTE